MKWKSITGTIIVVIAIVFDWQWFWVLLFLYTLVITISSGEVHFFEEIRRTENPVLYWVQITILLISAVYYVSELL